MPDRPTPPEGYVLRYDKQTGAPVFVNEKTGLRVPAAEWGKAAAQKAADQAAAALAEATADAPAPKKAARTRAKTGSPKTSQTQGEPDVKPKKATPAAASAAPVALPGESSAPESAQKTRPAAPAKQTAAPAITPPVLSAPTVAAGAAPAAAENTQKPQPVAPSYVRTPAPSAAFPDYTAKPAPGASAQTGLPHAAAPVAVALPATPPRTDCVGFIRRFFAFLIDLLVLLLPRMIFAFSSLASGAAGGALTQTVFFDFSALDILWYLVVSAYFILMTKCCGATLGKRVLRIKVVRGDGEPLDWLSVIYRETIGRYLNSLLCVGYLVLAADREHRGFHDLLADTRVVYGER